MFYNRYRDYLKPPAYSGNVLGESSPRLLANRAFHLNSEKDSHFCLINSSFHHQITEIKNLRDSSW